MMRDPNRSFQAVRPRRLAGSYRLLQGMCLLWAIFILACAGHDTKANVPSGGNIGNKEQAARRLFAQAETLAKHGDTLRAEHYYVAAAERGAPPRLVVHRLVRTGMAGDNLRSSLQNAHRLLPRIRPADERLELLMASLYLGLDDEKRSRSLLQIVLARSPDSAMGHYLMARVLLKYEQDSVNADHHFRSYLALAPDGKHTDFARQHLLTPLASAPVVAGGGATK